MNKQEESLMIQKSIEEFLLSGGEIKKLPSVKAMGFFNLDVYKERVDSFAHQISAFEESTRWGSYSSNKKISTRYKSSNPDRKPFRYGRGISEGRKVVK